MPCLRDRLNQSGCCCCTGECLYKGCPPCPCPEPPPGSPKPLCGLQKMKDTYTTKYTATIKAMGSNFLDYPAKTATDASGIWDWQYSEGWTSGFFPGLLWQLYDASGAETPTGKFFATAAAQWTKGQEREANDTGTHDVGFMIFGAFGNGIELGPKENAVQYKDTIIQAAHSLSVRYNAVVGMTRSWGKNTDDTQFEVIIDNLMNLELLFWAAKNGGDAESKLYDMAVSHVKKTAEYWIRDDGSTPHLCIFDPKTGQLKSPCTGTPQGYSATSTWARGQAWAIYGFTMAYRYTKDTANLEHAKKVSAFWLKNLSPDSITIWDFAAPTPTFKDTSAASIVASSFIELYGYTNDVQYLQAAALILDTLSTNSNYMMRGPAAVTMGNGHDCGSANCTIIETEYYAMEAMRRFSAL